MKMSSCVAPLLILAFSGGSTNATAQELQDVANMPRPIEALDNVWIEELTMMEVRDALAEGKTTALILTGGIEENGPYLTTGKHNHVLRVMGESIARRLGDALIAPIVALEPGNPANSRSPGTVVLSRGTYEAMLTDMATSLSRVDFLDHPGNAVIDVQLPIGSEIEAPVLSATVRTFAQVGTPTLQFNCVSLDELKDAQVHPGSHRDLQVRICGLSAYFVTLGRATQDEIIGRTVMAM